MSSQNPPSEYSSPTLNVNTNLPRPRPSKFPSSSSVHRRLTPSSRVTLHGHQLSHSVSHERSPLIFRTEDVSSYPSHTSSNLRRVLPSQSNRSINSTWTQSLRRIPNWVSSAANSTHRGRSRSLEQEVQGYDHEFKTELAAQSGLRVWYSNYTSVDWLHEHVKQSIRKKHLYRLNGWRAQLRITWDRSQGWVLVTLIGIFTALMAGLIVALEMWLFDLKEGYCGTAWMSPKRFCCPSPSTNIIRSTQDTTPFLGAFDAFKLSTFSTNSTIRFGSTFTSNSFINKWSPHFTNPASASCPDWILWSDVLYRYRLVGDDDRTAESIVYFTIALCFAGLSSLMTVYLTASDKVSSIKDRASPIVTGPLTPGRSPQNPTIGLPDESPDPMIDRSSICSSSAHLPERRFQYNVPFSPTSRYSTRQPTLVPIDVPYEPLGSTHPTTLHHRVRYFAAGSGIPEIKCILSGFVIRGYLGTTTMLTKSFGLALSVASGLSLGKEGPLVHIASCIGNILTRCFKKFNRNEAKRREVLSAACAAGVSVAFGAPIGGVLFSLEEVSYFFPPRVMWRSCWCAMVAATILRFIDPFKTGKTVLFEVSYDRPWHSFELIGFFLLGILGGILGACFAMANVWWTKNVRQKTWLKSHPIAEVLLVASVTVLLAFSNQYLKMGGPELVYEMLAECNGARTGTSGPCLAHPSETGALILTLASAAFVKFSATIVTFGIKCPAGIFIPSLAVGALLGRILGLTVEYAFYFYPHLGIFSQCSARASDGTWDFGQACVLPGVWAMVGAAAMLAGVTRTTVSLVVIVMELTGNLVYILPIAISVLVAKTTADMIESRSIYDLVIEASDLPYLDAKTELIHSAKPIDIMDREAVVICIEDRLKVSELKLKAEELSWSSSAGGFPLVSRDEAGERIVGYIGGGELEHGLEFMDRELSGMDPVVIFEGDEEVIDEEDEDDAELMSRKRRRKNMSWGGGQRRVPGEDDEIEEVDLSYLVDHAPVTVSVKSPMELLHEMFVRLGVRYLVVQDERGLYMGIIERNRWLRYLSWVERRPQTPTSPLSSQDP